MKAEMILMRGMFALVAAAVLCGIASFVSSVH